MSNTIFQVDERQGLRWAFGLMALTGLTLLTWSWWTWPDVSQLATAPPETTAFMARDRARGTAVQWTWVPAGAVSPHLYRAILVAEDIEFFSHQGFSVAEIRAALAEALATGEAPRGASTITQQVAKNLWLTPSRTTGRKLREALLTWQLERELTKRRILELYVNVAQFGPGIYGAEAAARHYFGKPAAALTEQEAARLAAGLPRPSSWNPASASRGYAARVDLIRERMARARFLWRHLDRLELGRPPAPEPPEGLDSLLRPADSLVPLPLPDTLPDAVPAPARDTTEVRP